MNKLKFICTGFCLTALFNARMNAQEVAPFGAGLMLGNPTGPTVKYNFTDNDSIDAAAGWAFINTDHEFQFHVDYLRHFRELIPLGVHGGIDLHIGVGGRVATFNHHYRNKHHNHHDHRVSFGVRGPVGLDYTFKEVPIELFAELAPVFDFAPDSDVDLDIGTGARYYF